MRIKDLMMKRMYNVIISGILMFLFEWQTVMVR